MDYFIEHIGQITIVGIMVVFILNYITTDITYDGTQGLFNILGETPTTEMADSQIHVPPEELKNLATIVFPDIKVKDQVYKTNTDIYFKQIYTVVKDGVEYEGTNETLGYTCRLKDVEIDGQSVLTEMSKAELEESDEIPYNMIYDTDTDLMYFLSPGSYTLILEMKFDAGGQGTYRLTIPIETTRY